MIIVFDSNVVLDALLEREPFYKDSAQVLTTCVGEHVGYLTANSLTDIFYVISKFIGVVKAKQAVRKLIELFEIISINEADCINALELPMDDFEDALLVSCAEKVGADCIISRDIQFICTESPVRIISPRVYIKDELS